MCWPRSRFQAAAATSARLMSASISSRRAAWACASTAAASRAAGSCGFEPELARYSGMLELEFQDQFTLKAFGVLETRLPGGQPGFSLIIVISAEFTPIQLGFGFTLNGVGGLFGLHRTVNVDRLVSGLRDQTLCNILFPTDIVANADRILSDLRQVFPPHAAGSSSVRWRRSAGTPTLLTADVGLLLEVPEPVRLMILGVIRGILPDERRDPAPAGELPRRDRLRAGALLVRRLAVRLEAALVHAVRRHGDAPVLGANANFLTTVGGFHPAYQPPPMNLPTLRRLTLSLLSGENPRLTLETYFAVTSNTAQFGARLELYAAAWKFNAYGFLSFDVLFQFNPFYFIAEVTAMLALRVGSSSIASIKLTLTLEGPTPWKAKGDARLKLCWFLTVKIRFNKTFGETRNTTLPDLRWCRCWPGAVCARQLGGGEAGAAASAGEPARVGRCGHRHLRASGRHADDQPEGGAAQHRDRSDRQAAPRRCAHSRSATRWAAARQPTAVAGVVRAGAVLRPEPMRTSSPAPRSSPSPAASAWAMPIGDAPATPRRAKSSTSSSTSTRSAISGSAEGAGLFDLDVYAFNAWALQGAIAKSELSFARRRKSAPRPKAWACCRKPSPSCTRAISRRSRRQRRHDRIAALQRRDALIADNPALRGSLQVVPVVRDERMRQGQS